MDSKIGLDYIVENKEYTTKLGSALDTTSVQVKKQVFELLSALCVYNAEGYNRALQALDHYKGFKCARYRFTLVVEELRQAKANEYRTVLFAFINCLIISTPLLKDRNRIRNEFIGLKLLDIVRELKQTTVDPDLKVQLEVFHEQRDSDESQSNGPHDVDLSCHLDVFYTVYNRVQDTPQEIPFLSILQHLLRIDPKEPVSDIIWDTAETLVHRATLMETPADSDRLLRAPSQHKSLCRLKSFEGGLRAEYRKQSLEAQQTAGPPPPPPPPCGAPPPPPPPPPGGGPPPPPPPPFGCPPPPPPPPSGAPPPPPPPGGAPPPPPPPGGCPPPPPPGSAPRPPGPQEIQMPHLETPKPKNKMKTFNWTKLPVNKIFGKNNIWSKVAKTFEQEKDTTIDFTDMEQLFCVQAPTPPQIEKGKDKDGLDKKKKDGEMNLLDGKRSLNIHIFIKQFRSSNDDIIDLVEHGDHDDFGAEKLRGLMKILPEADEIEMLRSWEGDYKKLGNAERFILQLIQIKNYKLRLECMLLKAEFEANMGFLEPSIESMLAAGQELLTSQKLQSLLYLVLKAGNFLNSGGYAGNAAGMKISSLHKLTDIRSNKPGLHLLHYVAGQLEAAQPHLLSITDDLNILEEASKTSIEQLSSDINKLDTQITRISNQIEDASTDADLRNQMQEFLPYSKKELSCLQEAMKDLTKMQSDLAEFFCEEIKGFKIEECFRAFLKFNNSFKTAIQENDRRRDQERVAEQRRQQRELEQFKRRSGSYSGGGKDGEKEEEGEERMVMNNLMHDIKEGFVQRRLPDGGFKQQYSPMVMRKFKKSLDSQLSQASTVSAVSNVSKDSEDDLPTPYSTPKPTRRGRGGSFSGPGTGEPEVPNSPGLRRRRSRVPSEEDDKLLSYLVASGHEASFRERNLSVGNIEQAGYGSLDRGLMRRSRGRKRPELLAADLDRDRSAPLSSAVTEDKVEDVKGKEDRTEDPKTKEIKRRVESWLKESEEDVYKAGEFLDKKREKKTLRGSNSDLKNGKGLGTLHEDKPLDAKTLVANTDVISAMEAIEGAALQEKQPRKKTPPLSQKEEERKKALIRSLGRRPSEDKVSLYVRKPSNEAASPVLKPASDSGLKLRGEKEDTRKNTFLEDKVKRSQETPTDFLAKIEEEKREELPEAERRALKYPFHRTTTPNTLREHLKETLVKNIGSSTDLAETIHAINDDEILDTFNIDSENIETPPVQRRAFRHKSLRLTGSVAGGGGSQEEMAEGEAGNDFAARRKNHKFRSLTSEGKPLGDRELIIKKKKESNTDLSEGRTATTDLEDDLGSGLFDRFSSARKTLSRGSMRRKKEDSDTSLDQETDKKPKTENWRSKIANKFRKSSDSYDFVEAERGQELRDYLGQITPMSEPVKRKSIILNGENRVDNPDTSAAANMAASRKEKRDRTKSRIEPEQVALAARNNNNISSNNNNRKSSYIMAGDYDSTLVDGKYVTSVPIISVEEPAGQPDLGNIRPGRSLKDLKTPDNRRNSLIERLSSRSSSVREVPSTSGSNVFDRLAGGRSNSRTNLSGSRPSLSETRASTTSLAGSVRSATTAAPDRPRGTLNIIRDISKDITKNLRKGREENGSAMSAVKPRSVQSSSLFSSSGRKPMSNLNGGSHPSISSSTRSLAKVATTGRESPRTTTRSTPLIDRTTSRPSNTSLKSSASVNSLKGPLKTATSGLSAGLNGRTTSSKENLSRSSSSASRSSVSNGVSRNGSLRTGVTGPANLVSSTRTILPNRGASTLPKTRRPAPASTPGQNTIGMSFMKPTAAARAKKVVSPTNSSSSTLDNLRKTSKGSTSTTSTATRVNLLSARSSRR